MFLVPEGSRLQCLLGLLGLPVMRALLAILAACSSAAPLPPAPPRPPVIGPAPRYFPATWKQPAIHCKRARLVATTRGTWECL